MNSNLDFIKYLDTTFFIDNIKVYLIKQVDFFYDPTFVSL